MEPYTAEGMARREGEKSKPDDSDSTDNGLVINTCSASNQINYELAGVVVHSGQANAGHYYSFIKDRRYYTCDVFVIMLAIKQSPK